MMTLKDAEGFAEEVDLMEFIGLLGLEATVNAYQTLSWEGRRNYGGVVYLCNSVADRLDRTVFPMSTMSLRIF